MSKLHGLVAFLALWAFVASSPINEEKRKDEVVNLLRELLLVDLEDELNLETSKRFLSSDPTVSEPVYTAVTDMRYNSKYSYVALRLSSDLEWEVAGTGMSLPQGFTFSEETMKGTLDEIRSKYLKRQQPSVILLKRGYIIDVVNPFAFILWVPDNLGIYARMQYVGSCDPLMDDLRDRTSISFGVYMWENEDDIDYSILFVKDN